MLVGVDVGVAMSQLACWRLAGGFVEPEKLSQYTTRMRPFPPAPPLYPLTVPPGFPAPPGAATRLLPRLIVCTLRRMEPPAPPPPPPFVEPPEGCVALPVDTIAPVTVILLDAIRIIPPPSSPAVAPPPVPSSEPCAPPPPKTTIVNSAFPAAKPP